MEVQPQPRRSGPLKCIIRDRRGRCMVMPRYTSAEAIDLIAGAVAGRQASAEQKQAAWEELRARQGYRLEWVAT